MDHPISKKILEQATRSQRSNVKQLGDMADQSLAEQSLKPMLKNYTEDLIQPKFDTELLIFILVSKLKMHPKVADKLDQLEYVICESGENSPVQDLEDFFNIEAIVMSRLESPGIFENAWGYIEKKYVLVYTDIILTGSSTHKILNEIHKAGAIPLAVCCYLDDREPEEQGKAFAGFQAEIPVISLANSGGAFAHGDPEPNWDYSGYKYVETLNYERSDSEHAMPADVSDRYPLQNEDLYAAINESHALAFNHIHRPVGRHFSFYLNVRSLLETAAGHKIIEEMYQAFASWIEQQGENQSPRVVHFYFPEFHNANWARTIANRLKERVNENFDFRLDLKPVYRSDNRSSLMYRPTQTLRGVHAVVLDWGAITGHSISRLTRVLAEKDVEAILCLVGISSMTTEEEMLLSSIARVNRKQSQERQQMVPVKWAAMAEFQLNAHRNYDCPLCTIKNDLQVAKEHMLSADLREYVNELSKLFDAKTRHRFFEKMQTHDQLKDCYKTSLRPDDFLEMAILNQHITRAIYWTALRLQLFFDWQQKLKAVKQSDTKANEALIFCARLMCMLASLKPILESNAFLRVQSVRRVLAEMALCVLQSDLKNFHRVALVVLPACSSKLFCEHIDTLMLQFEGQKQLKLHLLLEVFFVLERKIFHRKQVLEPLEAFLLKYSKGSSGETTMENSPIKRTCFELLTKLRRIKAEQAHAQENAMLAWFELKQVYEVEIKAHRAVPTAAKILQEAMFEKEAEEQAKQHKSHVYHGIESWETKLDHWLYCLDFFEIKVIPLLKPLLEVMDTVFYQDLISEQDLHEYKRLVHHRHDNILMRFTRTLTSFDRNPPMVRSRAWDGFKEDRRWIFQNLLSYNQTQIYGRAKMIRFLDSVPSCLLEHWQKQTERWKQPDCTFAISGLDRDIELFVGKVMFKQLLTAIFENAIETHRYENQVCHLWLEVELAEKEAILVFRNTGSHPNITKLSASGRGLNSFRQYLKAFQAEIHYSYLDDEKVYQVMVKLQRWRY